MAQRFEKSPSAHTALLTCDSVGCAEHLARMPFREPGVRRINIPRRERDRLRIEPSEKFIEALTACRLCHHDVSVGRQREGSLVEQAVMKRAERDSVTDLIGAPCAMPLDVCCFEGDGRIVQPDGKVANCAPMAISRQDRLPEPRIPA